MAREQTPKQRGIVGRVMHEFKHGDLESPSGRKVENPRQAIAIALHEAGSSRDETPVGNRCNLRRTAAKERQAGTGAKAARPRSGGGKETRAELYARAAERGIPGRSRMTKAQLARALSR